MTGDTHFALATLREIGRNIQPEIDSTKCPIIIFDGADGDLVPIEKSSRIARFAKNITSNSESASRKVIFIPLGGSADVQGHNVINTLPEGAATWIDYVNDKLAPKTT